MPSARPPPAAPPLSRQELRAQLGAHDPYLLLELEELRWRATADDIKKSYRRLVLKHHPDKQNSTGADEAEGGGDDGDEMFKAITEAFERLSDPKKRRDFDSLDEFDDSIPTGFSPATDDFFAVFAPVFQNNSRWHARRPEHCARDALRASG